MRLSARQLRRAVAWPDRAYRAATIL